jgi:hypothetical protein
MDVELEKVAVERSDVSLNLEKLTFVADVP